MFLMLNFGVMHMAKEFLRDAPNARFEVTA